MENKKYKTEIIKDKNTKFDFFIKVEIVGDSQVGKTSLLKRLLHDEFNEDYTPTKGYEFNLYFVKVNDTIIKFQIWDMCGADNYRTSLLQLYRNANLGILVYSVCSRESFNNLEKWIKHLRNKAPLAKIILLGNKNDDEGKREVSYEEGKEIYKKYELEDFMEISAKNDLMPNFMEIGAISIYKDYENGNDMSLGILSESIMLNGDNSYTKKNVGCC